MASLTMTSMRKEPRRHRTPGGRAIALAVALVLAAAYASSAEARCCRHGAHFASGVVFGAVIARPYFVYPAPVYYAPPAYYPPPAVAYSNPPVYVEQPGATAAPPPAPVLSVEERLRRLQSACNQGLLSTAECESKRQELLRLM